MLFSRAAPIPLQTAASLPSSSALMLMRGSHRAEPRADGVEDHGMGTADYDVQRRRINNEAKAASIPTTW